MTFLSFVLAGVVFTSCQPSTKREAWIEKALDVASYQLNLTAEEMKDSVKMPRSLWTGYTVDFLEEQLERESATLPIPYGLIRQKKSWERFVVVTYTTGQAVSFPAAFGMPMNLPGTNA